MIDKIIIYTLRLRRTVQIQFQAAASSLVDNEQQFDTVDFAPQEMQSVTVEGFRS
jgi:hypothetical protein